MANATRCVEMPGAAHHFPLIAEGVPKHRFFHDKQIYLLYFFEERKEKAIFVRQYNKKYGRALSPEQQTKPITQ